LIVLVLGLLVSLSRMFDTLSAVRLTRALRESFLVRPPPSLT
jgi:hypothetical protein